MPRQDTKLESKGAEFLVLGQLLIEGIPAYKTYTNMKGFDLVALSPDAGRAARIQAKSRWASGAPHFLIDNVEECDFVVLVRLNRGVGKSSSKQHDMSRKDPEFYVLSADADRSSGWSKIRWREADFEIYRRRWAPIRQHLGMKSGPNHTEVQ
jgi:hypothetical protein